MKYEKYLKKLEVMLIELSRDIKQKCYNKAISSFWFTIEFLLKLLLLKVRRISFEKAGKLIAAVNKYIITPLFPEHIDLVDKLNKLYVCRKNVDHRPTIYDEKIFRELLGIYIETLRILLNIAKYFKLDVSKIEDLAEKISF